MQRMRGFRMGMHHAKKYMKPYMYQDYSQTSRKIHIQNTQRHFAHHVHCVFLTVQTKSWPITMGLESLDTIPLMLKHFGATRGYANYIKPNQGWFFVGFSSMSRPLFELKLHQIPYNFIHIPLMSRNRSISSAL